MKRYTDCRILPTSRRLRRRAPCPSACQQPPTVNCWRRFEEVVYLVEVSGAVSVDVPVERSPDDGLAGVFMTIDVSGVEPVGPTPKGITWSGLNVTGAADRWVCRVLIDV